MSETPRGRILDAIADFNRRVEAAIIEGDIGSVNINVVYRAGGSTSSNRVYSFPQIDVRLDAGDERWWEDPPG